MRRLLAAGIIGALTAWACGLDFNEFEFRDQLPSGEGGTTSVQSSSTGIGGGGSMASSSSTSGGAGEGGGGAECTSPSDCPGMDSDCLRRTCIGMQCGVDLAFNQGMICDDVEGFDPRCTGDGRCLDCTRPAVPPDGTNVVACDPGNPCSNTTIDCPANMECFITCVQADVCDNVTVNCPADHHCGLICSGASACSGLVFNCGAGDGSCAMSCLGGACDSSPTVNCGANECNMECGDPSPTVNCGSSCECAGCP